MKKLKMTFTVFVDDEPEYHDGSKIPLDHIMEDLYSYICLWDGNVHGTVEVESESIIDEDL